MLFAWLTDISSTTWSEGKKKVKITAKIHPITFFSQNGENYALKHTDRTNQNVFTQIDLVEIWVLALSFF